MKTLQFLILLTFFHQSFAQQFERITNSPITASPQGSRSVAFVDVNNDGFLDVFISNGPRLGQNNNLYINKGDGTFEQNNQDIITKDLTPSDGATFGDIDNDGDLDAYIVNWYGEKNLFYTNNGNGSFSQVTNGQILQNGYSETASWGDFDKDGFLDLYITNSSNGNGSKNNFLVNSKDGTFKINNSSACVGATKNSRSVNWTDYDNDGDLDLFVSNEGNTKNELYRNDNGEFTEITEGSVVTDTESSTGSSWADYDNDGDLDLFVANFNWKNSLYRNDGEGVFTKLTNLLIAQQIDHSFGSVWGDIDNDGDLDLFVANGSFNNNIRNKNSLYRNDGDGSFTEITHDFMDVDGWAFGAAFGDYDNDGFLDLIVAKTFNNAEENLLYHNTGNGNNWVNFNLVGTVSNKSAIGAKVKIKATISGKETWQMREISAQSGYNCQNSMRAHFGLGNATVIEEMQIEWPLGNVETYSNIEINKIHEIVEKMPDNFVRANFSVLENRPYHTSETVTFSNLSVYDEEKETTFEWDFDSDGTVDSNDKNPSLKFDAEGFYHVTLKISNSENSDEIKRTSYVQINNVTGITDEAGSSALSVFPNPFDNNFKIVSKDKKVEKVILQNINGKQLPINALEKSNFDQYIVQLDTLKAGIYILTIQFDDHSIQKVKLSSGK